jgi:hypothetical protein
VSFGKQMDLIIEGKIPWNYEDFCKIAEWYHKLKETPKDDWDLKERGILLKDKDKISKITINNFASENQLAFYMLKEYGKEYFKKYIFRFFEITQFLAHNRDSLEKDKMTINGSDAIVVKSELLKALCLLPYSKIVKTGKSKNDIRYEYDYNEVIKKAKELMKENGGKSIT